MATSTIKSSGGDYTSLSAWEADKQADITGLGPEIAECYDLDDTTDVAISGWTTTTSDYIEVRAATAARCDGSTRAQTGNTYRLSSATSGVLRIDQNHVRVLGIEIKCTGDGIALQTISSASGSDVRVEDCVISSNGASASTAYTCLVTTTNLNLTLRNCIITGKRRALDCRNSATVTIDHCTIYTDAAALGVVADSELTCTNTYSGGHSSEDFWTGGAAPSGSNNASSDTSASTDYTSSLTSKSAANQFTNPSISDSTMDFTLKATADLVDNGTGSVAQDISDTNRSGTVDIGAFEYISGGATYTLTADGGSFTLTGGAAGLAAGRKLTAAQGSFTLTGGSAGLAVTRKLTAAQGSFTLTGGDVTFTYNGSATYTLTAEQGSFTLTGGAVTFGRTYAIAADGGSYALTGGNANFTYSGGAATGGGHLYKFLNPPTRKEFKAAQVVQEVAKKQVEQEAKTQKPIPENSRIAELRKALKEKEIRLKKEHAEQLERARDQAIIDAIRQQEIYQNILTEKKHRELEQEQLLIQMMILMVESL